MGSPPKLGHHSLEIPKCLPSVNSTGKFKVDLNPSKELICAPLCAWTKSIRKVGCTMTQRISIKMSESTITILDLYTHPGGECQEYLSLEIVSAGATKIWSNSIQGGERNLPSVLKPTIEKQRSICSLGQC